MALTGYGLEAGDDPAFDYVIQAATGIASLTGDPDGPPTLPGYSSADNSTGLTAALGLLAQIVSGRGGQIDVSLRDVMLSQLNYRASAYLNDGIEPRRYPNGAHSYYVPAQLFATAEGYLALFITHDGFWRLFCRRGRHHRLRDDGRARGQPRRGARCRLRGAGDGHGARLGGAAASARHPGGRGAHAARGVEGYSRGRRARQGSSIWCAAPSASSATSPSTGRRRAGRALPPSEAQSS